ncbi:aprataxin [Euwallacea fornicatus]|uniref:aprataxin n=1 Tax=Euwallacea fornicatus TaxID=995702 RepID=UPI00338D7B5C
MKRKIPQEEATDNPTVKKGFWALGLLKTMNDPKYIIKTDDQITMIKDMYPKAQHHFLVLPKQDISSLKAVTVKHLSLLKHMENIARAYVREKFKYSNFNIGYHADASMHRLHLHVISDDMDSEALKTKKHWNTFNTKFFLNSQNVIKSLEDNGKVLLPSPEECKKYLELPLKCHKCSVVPKNMPELKRHISTHHKIV